MAAVQPLIMAFNSSAGSTGAVGYAIGVQGDTIALGGQSKALRQVPYELTATLSDSSYPSTAAATVAYQTSPDGVTWTTQFSLAYNLATAQRVPQKHMRVGQLPTVFCRLNITATSGGTAPVLNAYLRLKQ